MTGEKTLKSVFDGCCNVSENADIRLKFDDGSTLQVHSFILKKASSVLRSVLEDCEKTSEIHLDSVAKEVWIDILSELYPIEHSTIITKVFADDHEALLQIGKECVKYGIESILGSMDKTIYHRVSAVEMSNPPSWKRVLGILAKVSSELVLSKSREIIAERIMSVMSQLKQQQVNRGYSSYSGHSYPPSLNYPEEMLEAIRDLFDGGDHEWNTWFSREMMFKVFEIDVRPKNA